MPAVVASVLAGDSGTPRPGGYGFQVVEPDGRWVRFAAYGVYVGGPGCEHVWERGEVAALHAEGVEAAFRRAASGLPVQEFGGVSQFEHLSQDRHKRSARTCGTDRLHCGNHRAGIGVVSIVNQEPASGKLQATHALAQSFVSVQTGFDLFGRAPRAQGRGGCGKGILRMVYAHDRK